MRKKIVVQMTTNFIVSVPEDWDKRQIEFHYNKGCHCISNEFEQLHLATDEDPEDGILTKPCGCESTEIKYLHDATELEENVLPDISMKEEKSNASSM